MHAFAILYNDTVMQIKQFITIATTPTTPTTPTTLTTATSWGNTSVPKATTWHCCLRTFHGVIHELLTISDVLQGFL